MVEHNPVTATPRRVNGQRIPYLFSLDDATRRLQAPHSLRSYPRAPQCALVHETGFALMYGLVWRMGEACRPRVEDIRVSEADGSTAAQWLHAPASTAAALGNTKFSRARIASCCTNILVEQQRHGKRRIDSIRKWGCSSRRSPMPPTIPGHAQRRARTNDLSAISAPPFTL